MARILVHELTPFQKSVICNGVGPKNCPFLCWLIPEFTFHRAADQHDLDYWQGGGIRGKVMADARFCSKCLLSAGRENTWPRALAIVSLSFIYFSAVALGGWLCFYWGKRRTRADLPKEELT